MIFNADERQSKKTEGITRLAGFSENLKSKMPVFLVIWLFLTILSPHQDLYKVFFHGVIIPCLLVLLFSGNTGINWKSPFLLVSLAFFAYASVSTFIVGSGPLSSHIRALRWGVEVSFCLLALYVWVPKIVNSPRWWGAIFLWLALLGAVAAIVNFIFFSDLQGRLSGLGALHNPIQAGSILLVYFSIGQFMLVTSVSGHSKKERWLYFISFISVFVATLLSESRGPIGAMLLYFAFLGVLKLIWRPRVVEIVAVSVLAGVAVGTVLLLYGGDNYLEQLLDRGMSYRLDIWVGYLEYPPQSWLFGFGAGTPPSELPAAQAYWVPNGHPITHAHNLFIGTLAETGVIGVFLLAFMIILVVASVLKRGESLEEKIRLLGILGLVFMLTLTGSHTVISSIKAVWLFLWLPVIFVLFWPIYRQSGWRATADRGAYDE